MRFPLKSQTAFCGILLSVVAACGSGEQSAGSDGSDATVLGDTAGSGDAASTQDAVAPGDTAADVAVTPDASSGPASCDTSADCRGGEICQAGLCREVCGEDNPCDGALRICDNGTGFCVECVGADDCAIDEACTEGLCRDLQGQPCSDADTRCAGNAAVTCEDGSLSVEDCGAAAVCVIAEGAATCLELVCVPSGLDCVDGEVEVCSADGTSAELIPCEGTTICVAGVCEEVGCTPGENTCVGNRLSVCDDEGNRTLSDCADCSESEIGCTCLDGACAPRVCAPGSTRCAATGFQTCNDDGLAYSSISACEEGESCRDGRCLADRCEPGTTICLDGDVYTCTESGTDFGLTTSCDESAVCVDGACVAQVCEPLSRSCSGVVLAVCSEDGLSESLTNCGASERYCDTASGICLARVCSPADAPTCNGTEVVTCNGDGSAFNVVTDCGAAGCADGACADPCLGRTDLLGCEFFTADFEQIRITCSTDSPCSDGGSCVGGFCNNDPTSLAAGLLVYNPGDSSVSVSVRNFRTGALLSPSTVLAGSFRRINLPSGSDLAGTSLASNGFALTSTGPVAVWHEGPRADALPIVSIDLTRLLPVHALGVNNRFVGFPADRELGNDAFRPTMTVIGTVDRTNVNTSPATATATGSGSVSIAVGSVRSTPLNRGQVLAMVPSSQTGDFSGSSNTSSEPVAVFSSYGCAGVPAGTLFCDHLLEQVPPVEIAGGREFVIARSSARGSEDDIVRVTAVSDAASTTVTYSAPTSVSTGATATLARGETLVIRARQSIRITTNADVMVHHYLVGAEYPLDGDTCTDNFLFGRSGCAIADTCSGSGIGDPSMAIAIPTAHWSDSHLVHTPSSFTSNFAAIAAPSGTEVRLNGVLTSGTRASISGGFERVLVPLNAGVNRITTSNPSGLLAHGYTCGGSYAYGGEFR